MKFLIGGAIWLALAGLCVLFIHCFKHDDAYEEFALWASSVGYDLDDEYEYRLAINRWGREHQNE